MTDITTDDIIQALSEVVRDKQPKAEIKLSFHQAFELIDVLDKARSLNWKLYQRTGVINGDKEFIDFQSLVQSKIDYVTNPM